MLRHSLGSRLALIIVCFSLLAIITIAFTAYRALHRDFEGIIAEQQAFETQRMSEKVDQALQLRLSLLTALSTTLTDGTSLRPMSEIKAFLDRQSILKSYFSNGLVILDENTTAIAEDRFVPGRIGTNYADRSHFAEALQTRQAVISRPIMGRATGVPLLSFVAPIQSDSGDLLGFISGSIDLSRSSLIPSGTHSDSSTDKAIFLVLDTNNSLYVEAPGDGEEIRKLPASGENALIDAALSDRTLGEVVTEDGQELIYATSRLERLGWLFIRAVPMERANAPVTESFNQFFLMSVLVVLVLVPLGYLVTRSAMRPLDRMTRRIGRMSAKTGSSARLNEAGPSEVRDLARAFNQLQQERDATSQMQEDFLSNVSHELRTPLTSINGALRLITSGTLGKLPDKAAEMAMRALRNGNRLQLLISDLLDFNKLSSGEMRVAMATQPLKGIVMQAIEDNRGIAQERSIFLSGQCSEQLMIHADAHRLRQILDNLISNAIKFSPHNGEVQVWAEPRTDAKVRLTVSDQGKGVPEPFKGQLFRRFAQAEVGTKRASKGTGLGLAICRELTLLMNGEIGAYNDNGAHFWVEFASKGSSTVESER